MEVEVLANAVIIIFRWKSEDAKGYYDRNVVVSIADDGLIGCLYTGPPARMNALDGLVELGIAEWLKIGPEDSEIFLTDEWWEKLNLTAVFHQLSDDGWRTIEV